MSKGGYSPRSPPISPRARQALPLRQYSAREQVGAGGFGVSPPRNEASPLYSSGHGRTPLPHLPQAHYYGAPELDFGHTATQNQSNVDDQETISYVFDSVASIVSASPSMTLDILMVAADNKADFYRVERKKVSAVGALQDLGGSIISAKVLRLASTNAKSSDGDWIVILIVHGPYIEDAKGRKFNTGDDDFDASESTMHALQMADSESFQTKVEVYSLNTGQYLTTLIAGPKVTQRSPGEPSSSDPFIPTITDVQANERFITISSGVSGEIFIFEWIAMDNGSLPVDFHCIGKIWTRTALRRQQSHSRSSTGLGQEAVGKELHRTSACPLLSLGHRWLAFVPPKASSQLSVQSEITLPDSRKVPGLSSHAAPEEPSITCSLESPDEESFINRVARDATQEFVKGARWVGNRGLSAWNKYWSQPGEVSEYSFPGTSPPDRLRQSARDYQAFPPTHAQEQQATQAGPSPIAILDLGRLSRGQQAKSNVALQPLATFSLPNGCSALSLAPNGIHLFTASAKGDRQQVWDLKRLTYNEADRRPSFDASTKAPKVREIARFVRLTEAKIIDIGWTKPNGTKLALLTDNGTIHVYALPVAAFYWPPLRRSRRTISMPGDEPLDQPQDHERGQSETSGGALSSAFNILSEKTQPLFSAVRGRTVSASSSLPGFSTFNAVAATGGRSSKAVAVGINRSVTAAASGTVNTLRHLGENRIHLPGPSLHYRRGCARWLNGVGEDLLAVAAAGSVRTYTVSAGSSSKAGRGLSAMVTKPAQLEIPRPSPDREQAGPEHTDLQEILYPPRSPLGKRTISSGPQEPTHPLSYAEIETHAPYQPFHWDRRVQFQVYNEDSASLELDGPSTFGESIAAKRITKRKSPRDLDDPDEQGLTTTVRRDTDEEDGEQITITTRRTKDKADRDDDFFEEDLAVVDFARNRV